MTFRTSMSSNSSLVGLVLFVLNPFACGTLVEEIPPKNPSCTDGEKNQGETGIDCGGPCAACPVGGECTSGDQCRQSLYPNLLDEYGALINCEKNQGKMLCMCDDTPCREIAQPTCSDGILNQGETETDCGGLCDACEASCTDEIQNQGETGVDCGGPCDACEVSCTDGIQNQGETGVDCGGPCDACKPSCTDGIQNQGETGVDCGGPCSECGQKTWQDCGGYVVMEAEDTESSLGKWQKKNNVPNYTGTNHLEFTGNSPSGGGVNSPMKYPFRIKEGGIYHIKLRAFKRLDGSPRDHCNDVYVKVEGDFTSGSSSVSTNALKKDCKLYVHGESHVQWDWARNLDCGGADHKAAIYDFKPNSDYVLTVSGRSQRYNLDRIVFHNDEGKSIALDPSTPQTLNCGSNNIFRIKALNDFPNINAGDVPYYKHSAENALAINASNESYRNKWGGAQVTFNGTAGSYDLLLTGLKEIDGESEYRIMVNGSPIGDIKKNDRIIDQNQDYDPQEHIWRDVDLMPGDEIIVGSKCVSNGQIPEGSGFAWARGRWTQLELEQL